MIAIQAVFIGGVADGRKMQINAKMNTIQIPNFPEPLTPIKAQEWTGWQGEPRSTDIDYTTYRVHIVDLRGHGSVAVCTTDFDLDYHGVLAVLLQGYNPDRQKSDPNEKAVDQILARLESYYHGDEKLARGAKHLSVNTDDLRTLTDYIKFMRGQLRAANRRG